VPEDAAVAGELAAITDRLKALASSPEDRDTIAQELGAIRAQLRLLAQENAEVGERLARSLGLESPAGEPLH
jgi:C4-dicarboxylate-specific signal transduction histidine kinase